MSKLDFSLKTTKAIGALFLVLSLTGCGQKGDLYLVKPDSGLLESADQIASTSNPQDAAFAKVDDNDYDQSRYLQQKQVLPDNNDDPNDYWWQSTKKLRS